MLSRILLPWSSRVFFTDNVRGDKNILKNASRSLKEVVQPVTKREPGTVVDGSNYPMLKLPGDHVNIRCLNRRDDIPAGAQELIGQVETSTSTICPSQPKQLVVGFDCEWPTDPITRAL